MKKDSKIKKQMISIIVIIATITAIITTLYSNTVYAKDDYGHLTWNHGSDEPYTRQNGSSATQCGNLNSGIIADWAASYHDEFFSIPKSYFEDITFWDGGNTIIKGTGICLYHNHVNLGGQKEYNEKVYNIIDINKNGLNTITIDGRNINITDEAQRKVVNAVSYLIYVRNQGPNNVNMNALQYLLTRTQVNNFPRITPFMDIVKPYIDNRFVTLDISGGGDDAAFGLVTEALNLDTSQKYYRARILLLGNEITDSTGLSQHTAIFVAEEEVTAGKVKIQKVNKDAQNLAIAGMEFEVYKIEDGGKETKQKLKIQDTRGNITDADTAKTYKDGSTDWIVGLQAGKYIIKEVVIPDSNNEYLAYGLGGNIGAKSEQFEVKAGKDTIIQFKNTEQLGEIFLKKTDEEKDNIRIAGVQFKIVAKYQEKGVDKTKYVQITDSSGKKVGDTDNPLVGRINAENGYKIKYVDSAADGSVFQTNTAEQDQGQGMGGIIALKPVEKYRGSDKDGNPSEIKWYAREISNKAYSYKDWKKNYDTKVYAEEDEDEKQNFGTRLTLGEMATVTNKAETTWVEIEKVDESDKTKKLKDVQFKIQVKEDGVAERKYLQLSKSKTRKMIGTEEGSIIKGSCVIDTTNAEEPKGDAYHVEYVESEEEATVFSTDENGKLKIENLEKNCGPERKFTYYAKEVGNENWGYKFSYSGMQPAELKQGETTQVTNKPKFANFQIIKGEEGNANNKRLKDVKFKILVKDKGEDGKIDKDDKIVSYLKLNTNEEVSEFEITGPEDVTYVTDSQEATTFKTDENGKIVIKGIEAIPDDSTQYYVARETGNQNWAYKGWAKEGGNDTTIVLNDITVTPMKSTTITNKPYRVNVKIEKVDKETKEKLKDVKFKIKIVREKIDNKETWLQLNGSDLEEPINNVTISENNDEGITAKYVTEDAATIFTTNESGEIVINNLEKYYLVNQENPPGEEITYIAYEVENPNKGYVLVTNEFPLKTDDTVTQIENSQELTNLQIHKIDSVSKEGIANVKFKIKCEDGYIQIKRNETPVSESQAQGGIEININTDKMAYVDEGAATVFTTDSDGNIVIKNIIPDTYTAVEIENANEGYEETNKELPKEFPLTSSGGTISAEIINQKKRSGITNISLIKVDSSTNARLSGVEFKIRGSNGYVRITENGTWATSKTGTVTIELDNSEKCKVEFVSSINQATTFVTDSSGKIEIKNIENDVYYAKEINNPNSEYFELTDEQPISQDTIIYNSKTPPPPEIEYKEGYLQIVKRGSQKEGLKGVGFDVTTKITVDGHKYLYEEEQDWYTEYEYETEDDGSIKYENGQPVKKLNPDGTPVIKRRYPYYTGRYSYAGTYSLTSSDKYGKESEDTKTYYTDENGLIEIKKNEKETTHDTDYHLHYYYERYFEYTYTYTAKEVGPNTNYGYDIDDNIGLEKPLEKNKITYFDNTQELKTITLEKYGEGGKALPDVEFVLYASGKGYKGDSKSGYVKITNAGEITGRGVIDKTGKNVKLVSNKSEATIFKTDSSGNIAVENLEAYLSYQFEEVANSNYWYKQYTNSGATSAEIGTGTNSATITMTNNAEYGNIEITKQGNGNQAQKDVKFVIQKLEGTKEPEYLQIYKGTNTKYEEEIKEAIAISEVNTYPNRESGKYYVGYTTTRDNATKFITNKDGKIQVSKLEKYYTSGGTNDYKVIEIENKNYGYKGKINYQREVHGSVPLQETMTNDGEFGKIHILKVDSRKGEKPLSGIKFVLKIKEAGSSVQKYVKINNADEITGNVTIDIKEPIIEYNALQSNATIFITDDNGEINIENLEIYCSNKNEKYTYTLEETDASAHYGYVIEDAYISYDVGQGQKAGKEVSFELTKDVTLDIKAINKQRYTKISGIVWEDIGVDGKEIVYDNKYGSNDKLVQYIKVTLKDRATGQIVEEKWTDGSGAYVFGISNTHKDGYSIGNNEGQKYSEDDDTANETQRVNYKIEIENLANYYIEFEYNGMKYESCVLNINEDNGSKAKEAEQVRQSFNDKFAEISAQENGLKDGTNLNDRDKDVATGETTGQSNDAGGTKTNDIKYERPSSNSNDDGYYKSNVDYKEGNAKVPKIAEDVDMTDYYAVDKYHIISTTNTDGSNYSLKDRYDTQLTNNDYDLDTGITNINQGIYEREQIDLAITSDIDNVEVNVNKNKYTYLYGKRQYQKNNQDDVYEVGVKYRQDEDAIYGTNSAYSRTVYPSDIVYNNTLGQENTGNTSKKMKVYVTYKITIKNQSTNLIASANRLINYYDANYNITKIWVEGAPKALEEKEATKEEFINAANTTEGDADGVTTKINGYKTKIIDLSNYEIQAQNTNYITLYITYLIKDKAVLRLLNDEDILFNNISEIYSYSTTKDGKAYASIDKDSAPGNTSPGVKETYEDDTDRAPAFVLVRDDSAVRKISGVVFRDNSEVATDGTRNGDGEFKSGERLVDGVKIEVYEKIEDDETVTEGTYKLGENKYKLAKLYDYNTYLEGYDRYNIYNENLKDASVNTGNTGTYELQGLIPGIYIVKFTYGDGSTKVQSGEVINVYDYKSTIYEQNRFNRNTSDNLWYFKENPDAPRLSDATDNWKTRKEIDADSSLVSNSTSENVESNKKDGIKQMDATTPEFKFGVEVEEVDEGQWDLARTPEMKNVDFGIVDRAKQKIRLEKEIKNLKVTLGNGNVIYDNDPATNENNTYLQYVPESDNITGSREANAKVVIDTIFTQDAIVEIKYGFTIKNESETDYATEAYYKHGIKGNEDDLIVLKVEKVVDYVDNEITFDSLKASEEGIPWERVNRNSGVYTSTDFDQFKDKDNNRLLPKDHTDEENGRKTLLDEKRSEYTSTILVTNWKNMWDKLTPEQKADTSMPGLVEPPKAQKTGNSEYEFELTLTKQIGVINKDNEAEFSNYAEVVEVLKGTRKDLDKDTSKPDENITPDKPNPEGTNNSGGSSVTYDTAKKNPTDNEPEQKTIIPGIYSPGDAPNQPTEDRSAKVTVTTPTGEDKQTSLNYVAILAASLSIVAICIGGALVIIYIKRRLN